MNYYIQTDDAIEKYNVTFSKEELFNLKLEIIENCSEKRHREYIDTKGPNLLDDLRIRNFKKQKVSDSSIEEYYFSYDEYIFPDIVIYIDKLLEDDYSVIPDIYAKELTIKEIDFAQIIDNLLFKLENTNEENIDEIRKIKNEINEVKEEAIIYEKCVKLINYYKELQQLISLKLVAYKELNKPKQRAKEL